MVRYWKPVCVCLLSFSLLPRASGKGSPAPNPTPYQEGALHERSVIRSPLPSVCQTRKWSDAKTIPGPELRWPEVAIAQGEPVVLGNRILVDNDSIPHQDVFVAVRASGDRIPRPSGDYQFLLPKTVVDSAGRLHMVWGEAPNKIRSDRDWVLPHVTDILYAYYQHNRWSTPKHVYRADRIRWHQANASLAVTNDGQVHVAFAAIRDTLKSNPHLVHLSGGPADWKDEVLLDLVPSYVRVAAKNKAVYVAYVASDVTRPGDHNSVFVLRAPRGTGSWEPPVRVQQSGRYPALEVWFFPASDGNMELVWLQSASGSLSGVGLRHAVSRDQGRTWSIDPEDLRLPTEANHSNAVMDDCGEIHFVTEVISARPPGPRLFYARRSGDKWLSENLPGMIGEYATWPTLTSGQNGRVVVAWHTVDVVENRLVRGHRMVTLANSQP